MSDGKELNKHLDTFDRLLSFFRWDADTPVKRQRLDELYAAVNYVRDRLVKQESPPSLLPDGDEVESKIEAHMYPGTRSLETVRFQETWASGFRACYLWLRERLAERAESPLFSDVSWEEKEKLAKQCFDEIGSRVVPHDPEIRFLQGARTMYALLKTGKTRWTDPKRDAERVTLTTKNVSPTDAKDEGNDA
jgi:hypothetical protein